MNNLLNKDTTIIIPIDDLPNFLHDKIEIEWDESHIHQFYKKPIEELFLNDHYIKMSDYFDYRVSYAVHDMIIAQTTGKINLELQISYACYENCAILMWIITDFYTDFDDYEEAYKDWGLSIGLCHYDLSRMKSRSPNIEKIVIPQTEEDFLEIIDYLKRMEKENK